MTTSAETTSELSNIALPIQGKDLLVRRMQLTDIDAVMEIEAVAFGEHHWSGDSFRSELKNQVSRYYSMLHKPTGRILGYCGYWIILDEGHITTIAVDPRLQGQGLGEVLLIKMLDRMMGQTVHWATLEVRASNDKAQYLYYKYLFASMGLRPHYYQDTDEPALIMTTPDILSEAFRTAFKEHSTKMLSRLGGAWPEGMG